MKILVVGGGGHVGGIIRPALEREHECRYLDLKPIDGADCIIGNVTDPALARKAVDGMDAVIYLAMGGFIKHQGAILQAAFDVNIQGLYLFLYAAGVANIRHFVYASTMSIFRNHQTVRDESYPRNAWDIYGLTKGLGEVVCEHAARAYPDMSIVAPRMIVPNTDQQWAAKQGKADKGFPLGPNDTRRLYLAAVQCNQPGAHLIITTGDVKEEVYSHAQATRIIGWAPQGN